MIRLVNPTVNSVLPVLGIVLIGLAWVALLIAAFAFRPFASPFRLVYALICVSIAILCAFQAMSLIKDGAVSVYWPIAYAAAALTAMGGGLFQTTRLFTERYHADPRRKRDRRS